MSSRTVTFRKAVGRWAGNAEVYDSGGKFLGNGSDTRHVQQLDDGRVRIDVAFVGPFKHAGHYFIQPGRDYRLYQGPANLGYAETLSETLVDANAYWPALGLTQRFFLMIVDEDTQLSLAQMSRGDHLMYVVVGQNDRVPADAPNPQPVLTTGTHYDLAADPAAGRPEILLHRAGTWHGTLSTLDQNRESAGESSFTQQVTHSHHLHIQTEGGFDPYPRQLSLTTNGWQAWSDSDSEIAGSYSLSGGRAMSGYFYIRETQQRVWQREVVSVDGSKKGIVQHWYEGGTRLATQFGVLHFEAAK